MSAASLYLRARDEIALQGSEGCTLGALWDLLPSSTEPVVRRYIWSRLQRDRQITVAPPPPPPPPPPPRAPPSDDDPGGAPASSSASVLVATVALRYRVLNLLPEHEAGLFGSSEGSARQRGFASFLMTVLERIARGRAGGIAFTELARHPAVAAFGVSTATAHQVERLLEVGGLLTLTSAFSFS